MLIIKISCRFTENLQKSHILFGLLLLHYKITLADKIKTLNCNIKANEAQCNLDKDAAKISALSELEKYNYLTGEDLGYKPWVVEGDKFEYY